MKKAAVVILFPWQQHKITNTRWLDLIYNHSHPFGNGSFGDGSVPSLYENTVIQVRYERAGNLLADIPIYQGAEKRYSSYPGFNIYLNSMIVALTKKEFHPPELSDKYLAILFMLMMQQLFHLHRWTSEKVCRPEWNSVRRKILQSTALRPKL